MLHFAITQSGPDTTEAWIIPEQADTKEKAREELWKYFDKSAAWEVVQLVNVALDSGVEQLCNTLLQLNELLPEGEGVSDLLEAVAIRMFRAGKDLEHRRTGA